MRAVIKKAKSGSATEAAEAASRVLREFVGDMLNLEGGALTPSETSDHLREAGVPGEIVDALEHLLGRCEAARYGGDASSLSEIPVAASALLDRLDRNLGS